MISVKDLQKSFAGARGEVRALRGVSFEVGKGELFTLLGPSGCGKTTTLALHRRIGAAPVRAKL